MYYKHILFTNIWYGILYVIFQYYFLFNTPDTNDKLMEHYVRISKTESSHKNSFQFTGPYIHGVVGVDLWFDACS